MLDLRRPLRSGRVHRGVQDIARPDPCRVIDDQAVGVDAGSNEQIGHGSEGDPVSSPRFDEGHRCDPRGLVGECAGSEVAVESEHARDGQLSGRLRVTTREFEASEGFGSVDQMHLHGVADFHALARCRLGHRNLVRTLRVSTLDEAWIGSDAPELVGDAIVTPPMPCGMPTGVAATIRLSISR